jgi:hypothetical protein
MSNDLIVLEKVEIVPFFTKGDQVEELLSLVRLVIAFIKWRQWPKELRNEN